MEKNLIIKSKSGDCIHPNNLLKILQDLLPNILLSKTQWKMIVNIGKSNKFESLIDINEFFRLVEITSKNLASHPNIYLNNKNKIHKLSYSVSNKYYINTDMNINNTQRNNLFTSNNDFESLEVKTNRRYANFGKTENRKEIKSVK